jgi:addiction module HigA family antidote
MGLGRRTPPRYRSRFTFKQRRDRRSPLIVEETMAKLKNVHPGEVLLEEFLVPMNLSQNAVARAVCVPPRRINEIVLGKRAITADTALRLARYFGTSEQLWMGLQADYDLEEARRQLGRKIERIERLAA